MFVYYLYNLITLKRGVVVEKKIEMEEVKRVHKLMQYFANGYVTIKDLAEEMEIKKTDLMEFIIENENHFSTMICTVRGFSERTITEIK